MVSRNSAKASERISPEGVRSRCEYATLFVLSSDRDARSLISMRQHEYASSDLGGAGSSSLVPRRAKREKTGVG